MKAFISYSLQGNDEFILTLLSFMLKEDNIDSTLSQNSSKETLDVSVRKLIEESSIFIGIALNQGKEESKLLTELDYALGLKIPCLLIVEDNISNESLLKHTPLLLNRFQSQKAIYEIERLMNSAKDIANKSLDSIAWIISGKSIVATMNAAFKGGNQNNAKFVVSGRLKLIEQQLLGIDSAAFQNLCDIYLSFREQELASINRTGSQFGKQKTVKGTPDTFFRLVDGSLRYVEYTTKADGLVDKIKEDIDKCLDQNKTGVPANQVNKIIICFNSRLNVAEETAITQHAVSKNIRIELIGLDWLALEIYSKYLILAKDILGIPLDTGQLLSLQNFIDEYNNKAGKLSTPLDNIFLHRKAELAEMENILATNDLLIISGFSGVGKTKIALEALNKFLSANNDYTAFAISKKDQDISEDLKIHLQQEKNYVLLVDDANRQLLNFKQILGIFKEKRKGNIKLVITVRDYALNDVINECFEFDPHKIVLKKFSDTEITELINSDSFEIRNPKYQKRIVEVADGNARLAVMAARVAKQRQEFFLLGDVSDLYDSYFQTFIKDFDIFGNKTLIKTLGIISFFFTIDRSNKEFIQNILNNFEIEYHEFNEAIDELENRELVEVQYNYVRVSEQVMATYFFYKVFIKDELLSFKTLLLKFYGQQWLPRFRETIISSNNLFYYTNPEILKRVKAFLSSYFESIQGDDVKILEFFSLFWIYKREELLSYFDNKIKALPESENPIYDTKYETNDFVFNHDKTLDFLSDLLTQYSESFITALELAFEYCRKKPDSLPEFIRRIREKLLFDEIDEPFGFIRQVEFFNLIISKTKENKTHYLEVFYALAPTYLSHYYQINKGGRKNTLIYYQYPLPFYEVTKAFRKNIWLTLFELYELNPKKAFDAIKSYRPSLREAIIEILNFDLSLLLPFIESKLVPIDFAHIHFVHDLIVWLDRENLEDRSYRNLKSKFFSQEYDFYKKLDWNSLRGRQDYEFENHDEFRKLKEQDIRNFFIFSNTDNFKVLDKTILLSLSLDEKNEWSICQSLDIIIEENFTKNNEIGFQLLENIFKNYPRGLNDLRRTSKAITSLSDTWALKLWELIKSWNNEYKLYWQLSYFNYLPDSLVNSFYKNELIETINSINKPCTLFFESYEKFISEDRNVLHDILLIAVYKVETLNIRISYSYLFFEKFASHFIDNYKLLTKAYLQQVKSDIHFDHDSKGLQLLVQFNPDFFIEYITAFYTDNAWSNRNTSNYMPFIWDLENFDLIIEKACDLIIVNNPFWGIGDYSLNILFSRLSETQKQKAKQFIFQYLSKNKSDSFKINAIFGVIRQKLNVFFEETFIYYLSLNTDPDIFQKISWIGNGGTFSGDTIIGEVYANSWQKILLIVEKCKNQVELIQIKTFIRQRIDNELKSAEWERKRMFSNPN